MRNSFIRLICLLLLYNCASSQEVPNFANGAMSPSAGSATKAGNVPLNYFTGLPNITVPIYSYTNANTGLNLNVSLNYFPGGIRVAEPASTVGLGWSLNAGGIITRTVRGMPDDIPVTGYMYSSAPPTDFRADASKYYHDSIDAQPDVFAFNYPGGSGKFYLGKNGQIAVIPSTKVKVIATLQAASLFSQTLKSFRIITEEGTKYDFATQENSNISLVNAGGFAPMYCGYFGVMYTSAWHLTQIISAFNTDTIKFNYVSRSLMSGFTFPQIMYLNSSGGNFKPAVPPGGSYQSICKIESIDLPDNTHVNFLYSYNKTYTTDDYALSKIKISDTAFRLGYLLEYQDSIKLPHPLYPNKLIRYDTRLFLRKVTPYTSKQKQDSYSFTYGTPLFAPLGGDSIQNKRDHWGFYNDADNGDNLTPNVNGYTAGANRDPNLNAAKASSLSIATLPGGGSVQYIYELNSRYPYIRDSLQVQIQPATNSQNNITLSQVFNSTHQLSFILDKSIVRTGVSPVSGTGDMNCYVKSLDGTTTYFSLALSLNEIFYLGLKKWTLNIPNGSYRLETQLSSGTSVSGSFPINITWENKTVANGVNSVPSGGIRVATIYQFEKDDDIPVNIQRLKYVTEDGKSSGFLGEIPRYDYPFRETVYYGGTSYNDFTAISSEPLAIMDYAQGSIVGYSRVEVSSGGISLYKNLGKTVYEFTDLRDVNSDAHTATFPYAPINYKSWGLGLPKRISLYDSTGLLLKRTVNTYGVDVTTFSTSDFKSLKIGHSGTIYYGNRNNTNTPRAKVFIGEEYYPSGGIAYLTSTQDSLFQSNGSINASGNSFEYDTNYNIKKITSSYDKSRGLQLEQRFYYPYDYTLTGAIGKLRDSNILSAMVATENWITGDGNPRLLSGIITSYKQLASGAIKPDIVYSVETNKPLLQNVIGSFDPSTLNRNATWFKPQTQIVNYDAKSNPLETKAIASNQSSSVIMDYGSKYAIAKVSNATNTDIAYTSFEADGNGNWIIGSSLRNLLGFITGKKSYDLSNGDITKASLSTSKSYLLTVWAKSAASVSVNGSLLNNSIASQSGWNLYQVIINNAAGVTVSGSGLIDELRLHPKEANMETTTYEPMVGVTSAIDANNTISYKEYDELKRVKLIRDKDRNIIKRFNYSDTIMPVSLKPNWEGSGEQCSSTNPGYVDSLYSDINPFSDSAGYMKRVFVRVDCSCPEVVNNPKFKVVNGQCEQGNWAVTSSVRVKINYVWMWRCTYKYCFSDGSQSSYYEEIIEANACSPNCFIAL